VEQHWQPEKGDVLRSGGAEYRLTRVDGMGRKNGPFTGSTFVELKYTTTDREITFAAVDKNGRETVANMAPDVRPEQIQNPSDPGTAASFFPLDIDDIDHFIAKSRPMEWVEFAGVAPRAARMAKSTVALVVSAPDPGSPEAAMAAMEKAIKAGDAEAAKKFTYDSGAGAAAVNDAMIELAIAGANVRRAAIAKFGESEFRRIEENRQLNLRRSDAPRPRYKIEGDTARPIDTEHTKFVGAGLRQMNGTWKMVLELSAGTDKATVHDEVERMRHHT
jgi:hypothetical protein